MRTPTFLHMDLPYSSTKSWSIRQRITVLELFHSSTHTVTITNRLTWTDTCSTKGICASHGSWYSVIGNIIEFYKIRWWHGRRTAREDSTRTMFSKMHLIVPRMDVMTGHKHERQATEASGKGENAAHCRRKRTAASNPERRWDVSS